MYFYYTKEYFKGKNPPMFLLHNWLEMQKVVTFPRFLMEHPIFIMYIQVMYMRKGKKEKNFFWIC